MPEPAAQVFYLLFLSLSLNDLFHLIDFKTTTNKQIKLSL